MKAAAPSQALAAGLAAAHESMKATIPMVATKGRARYRGERRSGYRDPGATSCTLLLGVIAQQVQEG